MGESPWDTIQIVVTGLDEVDPQFGQIEDVLVVNSEVYFNVQLFETCHFSDHYQSYVVTLTSDYVTIHHTHLTYHIAPLHPRTITGLTGPSQKAIILRHIVSTLYQHCNGYYLYIRFALLLSLNEAYMLFLVQQS